MAFSQFFQGRSLGIILLTVLFTLSLAITGCNAEQKPRFLVRMDGEFSTAPELILNGSTIQLKCIYENMTEFIQSDFTIIFKKRSNRGLPFSNEFYSYNQNRYRPNANARMSIEQLEGAVIMTYRGITLRDVDLNTLFECGINKGGRYGPKVFSNGINLDVKAKPYIKTFTTDRTTYVAGSQMEVTCRVSMGKPKGWVSLTRKRRQDREFKRVSFPAGSLTDYAAEGYWGEWRSRSIYRYTMTPKDNGMILRCSSWNSALRTGEPLPYKQIVFSVLFAPLRIQFIPATQPYYPGQRIQCHSKANPTPDYKWTKVSGRQDLEPQGEWLIIPEDTVEENLEYRCRVNNSYGYTSKMAEIYVSREGIKTEISLDNTTPLPGRNVTFKCSTPNGYPNAIVLKRLNDYTYPVISFKGTAHVGDGYSDRARVVSSNRREVVLSLRVVLEEDAGGWVCEADGVASETVYITFED